MQGYITLECESTGEYEEKRSKFIANIKPVQTEEEASVFIKEMKTKYWDAKHNVFAFVLKDGTARFSDDGEPHSTAGKPVLDIITGRGLVNVCVVVTRYFGGVLLGTGGLVRAYSEAAKTAIDNGSVIEMGLLGLFSITCDYQQYNRVTPFIENFEGQITDTVFTDNVLVKFSLIDSFKENFEKELIEAFAGRLSIKEEGKIFAKVKKL